MLTKEIIENIECALPHECPKKINYLKRCIYCEIDYSFIVKDPLLLKCEHNICKECKDQTENKNCKICSRKIEILNINNRSNELLIESNLTELFDILKDKLSKTFTIYEDLKIENDVLIDNLEQKVKNEIDLRVEKLKIQLNHLRNELFSNLKKKCEQLRISDNSKVLKEESYNELNMQLKSIEPNEYSLENLYKFQNYLKEIMNEIREMKIKEIEFIASKSTIEIKDLGQLVIRGDLTNEIEELNLSEVIQAKSSQTTISKSYNESIKALKNILTETYKLKSIDKGELYGVVNGNLINALDRSLNAFTAPNISTPAKETVDCFMRMVLANRQIITPAADLDKPEGTDFVFAELTILMLQENKAAPGKNFTDLQVYLFANLLVFYLKEISTSNASYAADVDEVAGRLNTIFKCIEDISTYTQNNTQIKTQNKESLNRFISTLSGELSGLKEKSSALFDKISKDVSLIHKSVLCINALNINKLVINGFEIFIEAVHLRGLGKSSFSELRAAYFEYSLCLIYFTVSKNSFNSTFLSEFKNQRQKRAVAVFMRKQINNIFSTKKAEIQDKMPSFQSGQDLIASAKAFVVEPN